MFLLTHTGAPNDLFGLFSICRPKLGGFPLLMLMLLTQTATREHILGSRQTLLLSRNRQEGKKYLSKSSFFLFWVVLSSNTVSNPCSSSFKCTWSAYSMCKRRCTHTKKKLLSCQLAFMSQHAVLRVIVSFMSIPPHTLWHERETALPYVGYYEPTVPYCALLYATRPTVRPSFVTPS